MARGRTSKREGKVAAQVFLRSVSGRSFRELGSEQLPGDLAPFRAPPAARAAAERFLTDAGFKVYGDELGLALTIEGRPEDFARTFGIDPRRLSDVAAHETVTLETPVAIRALVDEIVVLPKPDLH